MCTQFAAAIQGLEGGNCYDDEQLSRPIKRFIADYVRKQVMENNSISVLVKRHYITKRKQFMISRNQLLLHILRNNLNN